MQLARNKAASSRGQRSQFSTKGAIVRIKLINFLTYDYVEVYPGPCLNLIIGPNGTGKSTILCAICLGLAGKPSVTGRAAQVQDYIKHGCNKAYIEIELYNPGSNYIIGREIVPRNSTWTINRSTVDKKDVENLVNRLNIQVSNLCQFLPQDRVAEFVRLSPQELLTSTQKAIGEQQMHDDHCSLKSLREKQQQLEISLRSIQGNIEKEKQKNARLESDVKNYEDREKHLQKIKDLKMKRPWVEYDNTRLDFVEVKKVRDKKVEALQKAQKANAPLQSKLENFSKEEEKTRQQLKKLSSEVNEMFKKAASRSKDIDECDKKIVELSEDLTAKKQDAEQTKGWLQCLHQEVQSLENELAQLENIRDVLPLLTNNTVRLQELSQKIVKNQSEQGSTKSQLDSLIRDKTVTEQQLRKLQDTSRLKLELLRQRNRDAYNGVMWLQNNKDKFNKSVYEPIMTQVNVKDQKLAKYVESCIPYKDMIAFVCEDKDDMDKLMSVLRDQQKLNINAVLAPQKPLDSYRPPYSIDACRRFGFHSYVRDFISAPDAVMKYLCEMHRVHIIPVGNESTRNRVEDIFGSTSFRKFYTTNHVYTGKQSKYGERNFSTLCRELSNPRILTLSVDLGAIQEKRSLLQDLDGKIKKCQDQLTKLQEDLNRLYKTQKELQNERKMLQVQRDQKNNLRIKISQKRESIERYESETIDIEEEERKFCQNALAEHRKKCKLLREYYVYVDKAIRRQMNKVRFSFRYAWLTKCRRETENELREANASLQTLKEEVEEAKRKADSIKAVVQSLLEAARKSSNLGPNEGLSDNLKRLFATLPSTLEELDDAIHAEEARADCLLQTDKSVILDYKKRKQQINEMEKDEATRTRSIEEIKAQMEEIKQRWLPPLEELINKINTNFGYYFSELGCAGEVSLNKTENPDDFDKYGIVIRVKYRSNEPLKELSAAHQSGGERSVATVLYMMALQELTRVPFRCVDEINQGMDSANERRVFDLIVKTACCENSAQYFLLTPKLLPDLAYSPNMKIQLIHNGEGMMNCKKWNLRNFTERRKNMITD